MTLPNSSQYVNNCKPVKLLKYEAESTRTVDGYRYSADQLEVRVAGGMRTAQVLCRTNARKAAAVLEPLASRSSDREEQQQQPHQQNMSTVQDLDNVSVMTDGTDTLSVVSNLSELSELSAISGVDDDIWSLKRVPTGMLADLHGDTKKSKPAGKVREQKFKKTLKMLTSQRDMAMQERNAYQDQVSNQSSLRSVITGLQQKELTLRREKSGYESQLGGLSDSLKNVLAMNVALKSEILSLKAKERTKEQGVIGTSNETIVFQLKSVIEELKEQNRAYAKNIDAKESNIKYLMGVIETNKENTRKITNEKEDIAQEVADERESTIRWKRNSDLLKVDLEAAVTSKLSAEHDAKLSKAEINSVIQGRDWYQQQLKETQESRMGVQRELMQVKEDGVMLKSEMERLTVQLEASKMEVMEHHSALLKEKERMVTKLEKIELIENERNGSDTPDSNNSNDNRIFELERNLKDLKDTLKKTEECLATEKNERDDVEAGNLAVKAELKALKQTISERDLRDKQVFNFKKEAEQSILNLKRNLATKTQMVQDLEQEKIQTELSLNVTIQERRNLDETIKKVKQDFSQISVNFSKMKSELELKKNTIDLLQDEKEKFVNAACHYKKVEKELEFHRSENLELKKVCLSMESLESQIQDNNRKLNSLEIENSILKAQSSEYQKEIESLKVSESLKDLKEDAIAVDALRDRLNSIEEENTILTNENENLTKAKEELTTLTTDYQIKLDALTAGHQKLTNQLIDKDQKVKDLESEKQKLSNEMEEVVQKSELFLHEYNVDKGELENTIRNLEIEKSKMMDESLAKDSNFDVEVFEKLQNSERESKEKLKLLEHNLNAIEQRNKELLKKTTDTEEELDFLRTSNKEIKSLMELKSEQNSRLEGEISKVNEELSFTKEMLKSSNDAIIELEKDKGSLSVVIFENASLKENCAALEEDLKKFSDCKGKLNFIEQDLLTKKNELLYLEKRLREEQELNREGLKTITKAQQELAKVKTELCSAKVGLETANLVIETKSVNEQKHQTELTNVNEKLFSMKSEMLSLESQVRSKEQLITEIKNNLENYNHKEAILEEQMKVLNFHLRQKNHEIEGLKQQILNDHDRKANENYQLTMRIGQLDTDQKTSKEEIANLRAERTTKQDQIKQMQSALKTSLEHIRGLRSQLETNQAPLDPPPYDESSLATLLSLATPPKRPPMSSLQVCLSDLRQEVAVLNTQLSDKSSRGSTPSLLGVLDRSRGSTPLYGVLDRCSTSSLGGLDRSRMSSPGLTTSNTPSLPVSINSSLNSTPEHTMEKATVNRHWPVVVLTNRTFRSFFFHPDTSPSHVNHVKSSRSK